MEGDILYHGFMRTLNGDSTGLFFVVGLTLSVLLCTDLHAQPERGALGPIEYIISLPEPQTQIVEMSMTIRNVDSESIDVALPTWRPGRYEILDPAGTLRSIRATDAIGRELPIEKIRKSIWRIGTRSESVIRIDYTIYANSLSNRTKHVDDTHAFLSGESVFLYLADRMNAPVTVSINAPNEWRIASGLDFKDGTADTLVAPNYDVLIDSPIEIGFHARIDFSVHDVPHEIIIWGDVEYGEANLIEDFTKIIESQLGVWGGFPYERFVFLIHAGRGGGGTEHLNSTIMQTSKEAIEGSTDRDDSYKRFLGLVSHEFFHTWNVKALRPAGLVPYDYQSENYTKLLWVAEGTTSYYDDLTLARTELMKEKKYFDSLARSIDRHSKRPGRHVQSLEESSFDAWIKFNKSSPDDVNTEVSFYSKGALVSMLLDMEIRRVSRGEAMLDHVLRLLYESFPLKEGGYTPQNFQRMVEDVAAADFSTFFDLYVRGTAEPDFKSALDIVGLELYFKPSKKKDSDEDDEEPIIEDEDEPADADEEITMRADIGLTLSGTRVRSILAGGPAFGSGLLVGDEIIAIESKRLTGDLDARLKDFEPEQEITITYFRRNELREITITLTGVPDGEWKIRRVKVPTDNQKAMYRSWMQREWPGDEKEAEENNDPDATDSNDTVINDGER